MLPDDLRDRADRYTVAGQIDMFTHKLTFGPYTAAKVWISESSSQSGPTLFNGRTEHIEDKHKGSFELATASGTFRGRCVEALVEVLKHETNWELEGHNGEVGLHSRDRANLAAGSKSYRCDIGQPSGPELRFQFIFGEPGSVHGDDIDLRIAPLGSTSERPRLAVGLSAGFVLLAGQTPVAAVDVSTIDGSVTLSRELSPSHRDRVAAIAVGLLLLRSMD